MTMDEHEPPEASSLVELIEQMLLGTASEQQKRQLHARLLASAEDRRLYLHHLNLHSGLRRQFAFDADEEAASQLDPATGAVSRGPTRLLARWSWAAVAGAVVVAVIAGVYLLRLVEEPVIARITGLSGSLQWTGDGGRVFTDLSVGKGLPGGTVEGMAPGSWFELEFLDGSTVTISGNSMLTFSDHGQKKLHLKDGNVSGNVKPQPAGKPMLIYTRSAVLEIVGTRFEVEAGLAATMLNVSEGQVRVRRLSDDATVLVPANHRVVAAADREMSPVPVPNSVSQWKSQLHLGPDGTFGTWSPGTDTGGPKLSAVPFTTPEGKTIYTTGFGVSRGDKPPVMLQRASRLRVRGRIGSTHNVWFGVTLRHPNGEFAGRFQTIRPAAEFPSGQEFEVLLHLREFGLDPSLANVKDDLPIAPYHLVVETVWCHTLYKQAGLEIAEAEFLPPTTSGTAQPPTAAVPQRPTTDIWTAASQGNLEGVRRCLAIGADIDAAFIASGVPASGATPLHLAVLADQGEVAEFLIEKGANLGARAADEYGGTPLHWAAALGRTEMARLLIDAGADVNSEDDNGFTPLDATAYDPESQKEAKLQIARLLQEKGGKTAVEQQTRALPERGKVERRDVQPVPDSE